MSIVNVRHRAPAREHPNSCSDRARALICTAALIGLAAGAAALTAGCGGELADEDERASLADVVVDAPGAGTAEFRDPALAINGVRGAGNENGRREVFSLGTRVEPADEADAHLTLAWSGRVVVDGPGADFAVFENAFAPELDRHHFVEPAIVELSVDGETWVAMPHDYLAPDEAGYSDDPSHWRGFAGIQPVYLHEEENPVDPMDAALAGGDHFDLADLPDDDANAAAIKRAGFLYLRLVTASTRINPDTEMPFPTTVIANGPDIDGVYARYVMPLVELAAASD